MSLKTRNKDGILIFDIDSDDLATFKDDLRIIIEEAAKKTNKIIINLKELQNINSHLIGVISSSKRMLSGLHGDLVVINASEKIQNIFKVVHLDKIIKITTSENEAVSYLKKL
ncbi:MAG TPA: STAS domain-containing protein [Candidatus Wallbacteria bacterium]|nr:STAS domain-containing protein [Candidatus Wallbacteria bacterium]